MDAVWVMFRSLAEGPTGHRVLWVTLNAHHPVTLHGGNDPACIRAISGTCGVDFHRLEDKKREASVR